MDSYSGLFAQKFPKFAVKNGKVSLLLKVGKNGNFSDAQGAWKEIEINLSDLDAFVAGFTVCPAGIDGLADDEALVEVLCKSGKSLRLKCDEIMDQLNQPYVFWTNDGEYDDPQLSALQGQVAREKTLVKNAPSGAQLALVMDRLLVTLFIPQLPEAFLSGLDMFQWLSNDCSTHLIAQPEQAIFADM